MGLRGKILGGALVLLVPLGLSLTFLNQYGSAQIEAARLEKAGVAVTVPLVEAALDWYSEGRAELSPFIQALGPWAGPLNYTPEAMKAAGYPARAPEDMVRLAAGEGEFVPVMDELLGAVRYVADTSGLVLDPDLDSFYLMLALYQSLPNLVDDLTRLRAFTRPDLVLDLPGRLALHGSAVGLRTNTADLAKQVARSVAALPQAYVPVPGYAQAMDEAVPALASAVDALQADVAAAALEGRLDPVGLDRSLAALVPLLRTFQDAGSAALVVMLDGRIATFSARLTTAFAAALGGLVAATVVLLWVAGSIRRRSTALVGALGRVAEGDLAQGLDPGLLVSGDEVGRLARSTQKLSDDMRAQVLNIEQVSARLNTLGASLAASTEQSASAIEQMSATSAQVARFAAGQWDQTSAATQATSIMAEHIAESNTMTQGMAAHFFVFGQSMEANRRSIAATAQQTQTTGHLAEQLSRTGQEGERSLQSLRQSVGTVVERSKEIHTMVGFILDIAARTNLLAMNAAIEAAHAGGAGRGFAVVAEEIRKLAETSSHQAQGIEAQVAGIAEAADLTLQRSEATGQSFVSLSHDIEAVRTASRAIADQMAAQEEADARLSEGLVEFTGFYSRLSEAMEAQVAQSHSVLTALESLGDTSRQISASMDEQKLGMEQAAAAVVEVRDNANVLSSIVAELADRMARFRT